MTDKELYENLTSREKLAEAVTNHLSRSPDLLKSTLDRAGLAQIVRANLDQAFAEFKAFSDRLNTEVELLNNPRRYDIVCFVLNFHQGWELHKEKGSLDGSPVNPAHPMHEEVPPEALGAFRCGFEARADWRRQCETQKETL